MKFVLLMYFIKSNIPQIYQHGSNIKLLRSLQLLFANALELKCVLYTQHILLGFVSPQVLSSYTGWLNSAAAGRCNMEECSTR